MNYFIVLLLLFSLGSCGKKCEVCEVLKNGQMIERYESCNEKGIKTSREICEEMAKLQQSKCECKTITEQEKVKKEEMQPIKTLKGAQNYVEEFFTEKEERLPIADTLNDQMGANMAIIGDGILKKGYMPNGFEQREGYRIYKYVKD